MNILVIGGTRFFGIHTVNALLWQEHKVTIASRGNHHGIFGDKVSYIKVERTNPESMESAFKNKYFDVVIDKIAYCSNDIKYALDVLECGKYIYMSTTAVYKPKHINTLETDYDPLSEKLIWCSRSNFDYAESKRHAENALFQIYPMQKSISVRYPFVIGKDDYTNRLRFYIENTIKGVPMYIDNLDCQIGFINSVEAGDFMAFLVGKDFVGAVNGCSAGTVSIGEIISYIEKKCGVRALLCKDGMPAPYNGEVEYSINTTLAMSMGYKFYDLNDYIFDLIDYYIFDVQ